MLRRSVTAALGLAGLVVILAGCTPEPAETVPVQLWLTTPDRASLLERQPDETLAASPAGGPAPTGAIVVSPGIRYQSMVGFGASFTDSAAWLVFGSPRRDELMTALFDRHQGIGLGFVRQPIGASDFSRSLYTYSDVAPGQNDEGFAGFTVDHDEQYILPLLRQARQLNPALTVMATPWSAPAWLKNNGSLIGGGLPETSYPQYADYLVRFIRAYEAAGVPVAYLSVQNEPEFAPEGYPGMVLSSIEETALIDAVAAALRQAGLSTALLGWDHNWDDTAYPLALLAGDSDGNLSGIAWHCYRGDPTAQTQVHEAFPHSDVFLTECSGSQSIDPADTFADTLAWQSDTLLVGATRNWSRTVTTWNLALDAAGGPVIGSCTHCTGVLTVDGDTARFNAEYYVLGHGSKFVHPGAVRIDSGELAPSIHHVAFQNRDGSIVVIALNTNRDAAGTLHLDWEDLDLEYTLPPGALATLTWSPPSVGGD